MHHEAYRKELQLIQWEVFLVDVDRRRRNTSLWFPLLYRTIIYDIPTLPTCVEFDELLKELEELPPPFLFMQDHHDLDGPADFHIWMY